ncbi:MAG: SWIM zinc finger domain-containing protein [Aureliella sp.]
MKVDLTYGFRSGLTSSAAGDHCLHFAPNLSRDAVGMDAPLTDPLRFREAISALHDIVVSDLRFQRKDKSNYLNWKASQRQAESKIRQEAIQSKLGSAVGKPTSELTREYKSALKKYWNSRKQLNSRLRSENRALWRKLMPYDPVITVADDVVFFECFSADESSYGCLTVDREGMFGRTNDAALGTTNVDYSWALYDSFQKLRTYRETRFQVDPSGLDVSTTGTDSHHEEKIDLPDGWLRGFMQLQSAMCLPMRRVELSVGTAYSLLAFLKRNRERKGPRAIRFELADGKSPRIVLEPWETALPEIDPIYQGNSGDPIRVWGRRRLEALARVLPLCTSIDVYLLGSGLPSFWVAKMGNMRLTLGLSGWTTNDWTRGSAVNMLLPTEQPSGQLVTQIAEYLARSRAAKIDRIAGANSTTMGSAAHALSHLAQRGQVIFDLGAGKFRWRQVMPIELSDRELGPPHPEQSADISIRAQKNFSIANMTAGPRGGTLVIGKVEHQNNEVLIDSDGSIRKGRCECGWHYKYGIRNGPCRHLQVLRDAFWHQDGNQQADWYERRLAWVGG